MSSATFLKLTFDDWSDDAGAKTAVAIFAAKCIAFFLNGQYF